MDSFVSPNLKSILSFIDHHLAENTWFCGDEISGADFQMSFPLEAANSRGIINANYPHMLNTSKPIKPVQLIKLGWKKAVNTRTPKSLPH